MKYVLIILESFCCVYGMYLLVFLIVGLKIYYYKVEVWPGGNEEYRVFSEKIRLETSKSQRHFPITISLLFGVVI